MAGPTMSKKAPDLLATAKLPLLARPEALMGLLDGVLATSFTFAEPRVSEEVRMLEELRQDLLGVVDVWPRLGTDEQQRVKEALAEHLERLETSGWALTGERQAVAEQGGTVLRIHALRQRTGRNRYAGGAPRGLLH